MSKKIKGTGVALVTPFHKDGSIDFKGFERLIEHLITNKVDYLVPLGTTGESVTLSKDEKRAVMDFVIEINNDRLPIVMGFGGNNTQEILNSMGAFDFDGIDALLSVSPYYNKPSQRGIYEHYKMVAGASPLPIILYNVPGRTGSNMTAETTLSLANEVGNIMGIKEASGNFEQVMKIVKNKPKEFMVISGDDGITLPLISCGVEGVISVVANVYPKEFAECVRLASKGHFDKAKEIHYNLLDLINLLFVEGSPAGPKTALSHMGICSEYLRLPLVQVSKSTSNSIQQFISNYNA